MRIIIVTPGSRASRHDGRQPALRWATHLRALGHAVDTDSHWESGAHDLMIVEEVRHGRDAVHAWRRANPRGPLVLMLRGGDEYREIEADAALRDVLGLASRLVLPQEKALEAIAEAYRPRVCVIPPSVRTYRRQAPPRSYFLACVLGAMEEGNDPFCAARALAFLDPEYPLRIVQIGRATDARLDTEARERMRVDSRYRWLGELDHTSANRWLARSHALVVSGRNDDSVNAVAEALGVGLPVMASRIDGHVGLLGDDYPAYFPEGNDCALAALLARAQERPGFYGTVAAAVQARRHLVEPTKERKAIRALLAELRARKA